MANFVHKFFCTCFYAIFSCLISKLKALSSNYWGLLHEILLPAEPYQGYCIPFYIKMLRSFETTTLTNFCLLLSLVLPFTEPYYSCNYSIGRSTIYMYKPICFFSSFLLSMLLFGREAIFLTRVVIRRDRVMTVGTHV